MTQNAINNIQFSSLNVQTFSTSGTYTPTTAMKFCLVTMVGAGGAGGGSFATGNKQCSAGGGGGSGAYIQLLLSDAEIGASQVITIGNGGLGVLGANGGNGGTTSMGALMSCTGGNGGQVGIISDDDVNGFALPGTGGTFAIFTGMGITTLNGDTGQTAGYAGSDDYASSGKGGSTPFGSSDHEFHTIGGFYAPPASVNYGCGGSGGISTANRNAEAGGHAASAYVSILEFI